jgi:hypothetical protein
MRTNAAAWVHRMVRRAAVNKPTCLNNAIEIRRCPPSTEPEWVLLGEATRIALIRPGAVICLAALVARPVNQRPPPKLLDLEGTIPLREFRRPGWLEHGGATQLGGRVAGTE